jgi:hypothetical protein
MQAFDVETMLTPTTNVMCIGLRGCGNTYLPTHYRYRLEFLARWERLELLETLERLDRLDRLERFEPRRRDLLLAPYGAGGGRLTNRDVASCSYLASSSESLSAPRFHQSETL